MTTKRMARMLAWIEANPYEVYGDYRDTVSDEQAQMIIAGEFDKFWESWCEVEFNASDYAYWADWEQEFADEFGLEDWDSVSETIKEVCYQNRVTDCSDLLSTCLKNWRGHVCARLLHSNGDAIEFPSPYEHDDNAKRARFLAMFCGIHGDSEATYDGTYLTALGRVDLKQILDDGKAHEFVTLEAGKCFTIGHEPWNGSGTCANDQYKGKRRTFRADFFVDGQRGYGVDSIFGLTGQCWQHDLHHSAENPEVLAKAEAAAIEFASTYEASRPDLYEVRT